MSEACARIVGGKAGAGRGLVGDGVGAKVGIPVVGGGLRWRQRINQRFADITKKKKFRY